MSLGDCALILLRLDARIGQRVTVSELADHIGIGTDRVVSAIDRMDREHWLTAHRSQVGAIESASVQMHLSLRMGAF